MNATDEAPIEFMQLYDVLSSVSYLHSSTHGRPAVQHHTPVPLSENGPEVTKNGVVLARGLPCCHLCLRVFKLKGKSRHKSTAMSRNQ